MCIRDSHTPFLSRLQSASTAAFSIQEHLTIRNVTGRDVYKRQGHAYSTGDSATLNGMTIGVCVASAFSGRNDAALIKITNSNYSMSDVVNVSNHTLSNDKYMLVSEGATIYKVGSTSGYRSGTVTSTNGSVTYRINNQPLTCLLYTSRCV